MFLVLLVLKMIFLNVYVALNSCCKNVQNYIFFALTKTTVKNDKSHVLEPSEDVTLKPQMI